VRDCRRDAHAEDNSSSTTQHNTTQHNTTQHNTTQHSRAEHNTGCDCANALHSTHEVAGAEGLEHCSKGGSGQRTHPAGSRALAAGPDSGATLQSTPSAASSSGRSCGQEHVDNDGTQGKRVHRRVKVGSPDTARNVAGVIHKQRCARCGHEEGAAVTMAAYCRFLRSTSTFRGGRPARRSWGTYTLGSVVRDTCRVTRRSSTRPRHASKPHASKPRRPHTPHASKPHASKPRRTHTPHASKPRRPHTPHASRPRRPHTPHASKPRRTHTPHASKPRRTHTPHASKPRRPHTPHASKPRRPHTPHINMGTAPVPGARVLPACRGCPKRRRSEEHNRYTHARAHRAWRANRPPAHNPPPPPTCVHTLCSAAACRRASILPGTAAAWRKGAEERDRPAACCTDDGPAASCSKGGDGVRSGAR
jgi:hypothetical protein